MRPTSEPHIVSTPSPIAPAEVGRWRDAKGRLSFYALACGYIERFEFYDRRYNEWASGVLCMEHGSISVRIVDHKYPDLERWEEFGKDRCMAYRIYRAQYKAVKQRPRWQNAEEMFYPKK
jgi:hypothetical protein